MLSPLMRRGTLYLWMLTPHPNRLPSRTRFHCYGCAGYGLTLFVIKGQKEAGTLLSLLGQSLNLWN